MGFRAGPFPRRASHSLPAGGPGEAVTSCWWRTFNNLGRLLERPDILYRLIYLSNQLSSHLNYIIISFLLLSSFASMILSASFILFYPIFQGLSISLMARAVSSLLLSRMAVPSSTTCAHERTSPCPLQRRWRPRHDPGNDQRHIPFTFYPPGKAACRSEVICETEGWPPHWHTGVLQNIAVKCIKDAVASEPTNDDPRARLEPHDGGNGETRHHHGLQ